MDLPVSSTGNVHGREPDGRTSRLTVISPGHVYICVCFLVLDVGHVDRNNNEARGGPLIPTCWNVEATILNTRLLSATALFSQCCVFRWVSEGSTSQERSTKADRCLRTFSLNPNAHATVIWYRLPGLSPLPPSPAVWYACSTRCKGARG